jgi:hypothetical protein
MTRILVQPEHLRILADQCRRQADELRSLLAHLGSALGSLDWQVYVAADVERAWQSARGRGYSLAEQAEALARYLDRKAQAFAEADGVGAAQVGQVAGAFAVAQQQWSTWWQQRSALFTFPQNLVEWLLRLGGAVITTPITWVMSGLSGATAVVGGLLVGRRDLRGPQSPRPQPRSETTRPTTTGPPGPGMTGPPPPPVLREADPAHYSSCVVYAQTRRPDLGRAEGDGGAYNYIQQYRESPRYYRVPPEAAQSGRLQETHLRPGTVVVWDRGQQGANPTYGHVAIIEAVGPDYIEVSEAGWGNSTRRRIPATDLPDLHFIL